MAGRATSPGAEDLLLVITVEQHLSRILGTVRRLPSIDIGLLDAHGCVLAEDVASDVDLPGFTNSAMDGYAVRAAEVAGATADTPVHLPVVGDIAAGNTKALSLAPGADDADHDRGADPARGRRRRPRRGHRRAGCPGSPSVRPPRWAGTCAEVGEDVHAGDVVLRAGVRLGPRQIGLLAAVGGGPGAGGAPARGSSSCRPATSWSTRAPVPASGRWSTATR